MALNTGQEAEERINELARLNNLRGLTEVEQNSFNQLIMFRAGWRNFKEEVYQNLLKKSELPGLASSYKSGQKEREKYNLKTQEQ